LLSEPHQWEHEQNCQNAHKYLFWFHDVYCLLNQDFHFGILGAKNYTPKSIALLPLFSALFRVRRTEVPEMYSHPHAAFQN
jgi:hypothetical protein